MAPARLFSIQCKGEGGLETFFGGRRGGSGVALTCILGEWFCPEMLACFKEGGFRFENELLFSNSRLVLWSHSQLSLA